LGIHTCENTFSTIKQVKCKNRNRTASGQLDDSLRLATTTTGIDKGRAGPSRWGAQCKT